MKDQYAQAKADRNKRIRARRQALDEALKAYVAARKLAIASGTKLPNFRDYEPVQSY